MMDTISATNARKTFFELVKNTIEGHQTVRIQHAKGSAILISENDYEDIIETIELLSIPGFRESLQRSVNQINDGDTVSMSDVFGETDE
jgi:antitoxin YefM